MNKASYICENTVSNELQIVKTQNLLGDFKHSDGTNPPVEYRLKIEICRALFRGGISLAN